MGYVPGHRIVAGRKAPVAGGIAYQSGRAPHLHCTGGSLVEREITGELAAFRGVDGGRADRTGGDGHLVFLGGKIDPAISDLAAVFDGYDAERVLAVGEVLGYVPGHRVVAGRKVSVAGGIADQSGRTPYLYCTGGSLIEREITGELAAFRRVDGGRADRTGSDSHS